MKHKKIKHKTHEQMVETVGSIIDVFEDFLESKGVTLTTLNQSDNKEKMEYADGDLTGLAIIFGSDYDKLEREIENILEDKLR